METMEQRGAARGRFGREDAERGWGRRAVGALFADLGVRVALYHHISDEGHAAVDGLGVRTPVAEFGRHLEYYGAHYDVVGLDDLEGPSTQRAKLLITFDDCYASVANVAGVALAARGMPGVFFVNSGPLETGEPMLDNVLCLVAARRGVGACAAMVGCGPVGSVGEVIQRLAGLGYEQLLELRERVRHEAHEEWCEVCGSGLYASREEVRSLAAMGVEVGSHTATHVHTRCLDEQGVGAELLDNKGRLEELTGRRVRSFSFPYGGVEDATPLVQKTLRDSGHRASFLVHALPNSGRVTKDLWYRVGLSDEPASQLWRRLEAMPRMRGVRDLWRRHA